MAPSSSRNRKDGVRFAVFRGVVEVEAPRLPSSPATGRARLPEAMEATPPDEGPAPPPPPFVLD